MDAKLWVLGGTALLPGRVLPDAAIGITGGKISHITTRSQAQIPAGARKIDAVGCLVMPGLINGHTHTGMSLLRGIGDDLPLMAWLNERIFPLERKHASKEFSYWGTMLACAEMIRSGTTTFNDMYFFEDECARASDEAGMRMVAGQSLVETSDVDGSGKNLDATFDHFFESIEQYKLVTGTLAPHSIYSVSKENWKWMIGYAETNKKGIHFHLSEVMSEMDESKQKYGKTPTQVLAELGLWEQRVTVAHAVCVTPEDIAILGKHRVGVSHNPESNMKLGTLVAPIQELRKAGARVAIGTDSTASNNNLDLLQEADFAAKLQAFKYGAGAIKVEEIFQMLTAEGAEAVGLGEVTGSLEVGKAADIIAVDITGPHAVPMYNPYSHLVYSASGRDVKHSVINGAIVMEDRNLMTLDEQEIVREAAAWAKRLTQSVS